MKGEYAALGRLASAFINYGMIEQLQKILKKFHFKYLEGYMYLPWIEQSDLHCIQHQLIRIQKIKQYKKCIFCLILFISAISGYELYNLILRKLQKYILKQYLLSFPYVFCTIIEL